MLCGLVCLTNASMAGNSDLEIHVVPRGLDHNEKRTGTGSGTDTVEHWVYDITIENKTFKELTDLQVTYNAFYKHERFGSTSKDAPEAKRKTGTIALPSIKPHEKKVLTTDQLELTKHYLTGGWYFSNGGKIAANDALDGLWVRVMQGGQLFAEYANPSTLIKEKWE